MSNQFWKSVFPLFCILLIDAISFGLVIPILGPMLLEPSSKFLPSDTPLNMRTLYYSLCLSLPIAFMFLGAPLLGDISDQIGRKKALLIAMLGITFSCMVSAIGIVVGSVFLLLAGRSILGFMDSSESVAKAAIADVSATPKQKVLNLSLASVAGTVGFIFGPMIGGFLATSQTSTVGSYVLPFVVAAVLAFVNAIVFFFIFHETFQPTVKKKIKLLSSITNLKEAFVDRRIRLLSVIYFCMQFTWGTYFQSISILLVKAFHYDPKQIGLFLSFLSFCFIITLSIIIRILMNYLEQRAVVIISFVLLTLGSIIISIGHTEIAPWISVVPLSVGVGLSYNTILSLFSEAVDKDNQGRMMGLTVAVFSGAWVLSSIMGGLISSINLYLPYMVATCISLIGLYLGFYIKEESPGVAVSS